MVLYNTGGLVQRSGPGGGGRKTASIAETAAFCHHGVMSEIIVHTDGGCSGNPGPGAWAYVMRYDSRLKEVSGFEADTTNNRMELRAVIEALGYLSSRRRQVAAKLASMDRDGGKREKTDPEWLIARIIVFTDSQYVKNGLCSWLPSWKARGWKTADKKPVKNQDLWMELDALARELGPSFRWVEGHAGEPDNERCDSLVQAQIRAHRPG